MGIGEIVGDIGFKFIGARFKAIDGGVFVADGRAVGGFGLGRMEDSFLEVKSTAGVEHEAIGGMVRIGRSEAAEDSFFKVGLAIAISVLEKHEVRRLGNDDAAVIKFKTGGAMEMICKHGAFVGFAIAIGIFEDEEFVVHFVHGFQC